MSEDVDLNIWPKTQFRVFYSTRFFIKQNLFKHILTWFPIGVVTLLPTNLHVLVVTCSGNLLLF